MRIVTDSIKLMLERLDKATDNNQKNEILFYAIIAEAKENNDLAGIICRGDAQNIIESFPKLFNQFSTVTSEILLSVATPAYVLFGDNDAPQENDLKDMNKSSFSKLQGKKSSELYEFYIRKCNIIKNLYLGEALSMPRISLQKRCKNIEHATRILASRFTSKGIK